MSLGAGIPVEKVPDDPSSSYLSYCCGYNRHEKFYGQ